MGHNFLFSSIVLCSILGLGYANQGSCDASLDLVEGTWETVQSPGFPNKYPKNQDCRISLKAPVGLHILVHFTMISLQPDDHCSDDHVKVIDAKTNLTTGFLCTQKELPAVWKSETNEANILFHSNRYNEGVGYRAFVTAVNSSYESPQIKLPSFYDSCSSQFQLSDKTISISSPGFPHIYGINMNCVLRFTAPPGKLVMIKFTMVHIETNEGCTNDYIKLDDGKTNLTQGRYCTDVINKKPIVWISETEMTSLTFVSSRYNSYNGYQAEIKAVSHDHVPQERKFETFYDSCRRTFNIVENKIINIASPEHPGNYPKSSDCRIKMIAPSGYRLHVKFTFVYIETNDGCTNDYIQLIDSNTNLTQGRYCKDVLKAPKVWISESEKADLFFVTNRYNQYKGYKFEVKAVPSNFVSDEDMFDSFYDDCNRNYDLSDGKAIVVASPGYPGLYPANQNCVTRFTAPTGKEILVKFTHVHIETNDGCTNDYLKVTDVKTSLTSGKHCYDVQLKPIAWISETNEAKIEFISSRYNHYYGYRAEISVVNSNNVPQSKMLPEFYHACNKQFNVVKGKSIDIASPNYPGNYPNDLNCEVTINAPKDMVIVIEIKNYKMESDCNDDYFKIQDPVSKMTSGKICGNNGLSDYFWVSDSTSTKITFKTSRYNHYRGFRIEVSATLKNSVSGIPLLLKTFYESCPSTHALSPGHKIEIASQNYPDNPTSNQNCKIVLKATPNRKIFIRFTYVRMNSCQNTFFKMTDIQTRKTSGNYCQNGIIDIDQRGDTYSWISDSPNAELQYSLKDYRSRSVFKAEVTSVPTNYVPPSNLFVEHCNHDIVLKANGEEVDLVSPSYPANYPNNKNCQVNIKAPNGMRVLARFVLFQLEQSSFCIDDFVKLEDPETGLTSGLICGFSKASYQYPAAWLSESSKTVLKFKSDASSETRGYRTKLRAVPNDYAIKDKIWAQFYTGCNEQYQLSAGRDYILTSIGYPFHYSNNLNCKLEVTAPKGMKVMLEFSMIQFEQCSDFMEIKDNQASERSGPICKDQDIRFISEDNPKTWVSKSESSDILYFTDNNSVRSGFRTRARAVSADFVPNTNTFDNYYQNCPGNIVLKEGKSQMVSSPNYPKIYSNNQHCEISVTAPKGTLILVLFKAIHFEKGTNCNTDYLLIYDVKANITSSRICFDRMPVQKVWHSKTEKIKMLFHTDRGTERDGYSAELVAVRDLSGIPKNVEFLPRLIQSACRGSYEIDEKVELACATYPLPYNPSQNCDTKFIAKPRKRILITFTSLVFEISGDICKYDYIQLFDLGTLKSTRRVCKLNEDKLFFLSESNEINLKLITDQGTHKQGYYGTIEAVDNTFSLPEFSTKLRSAHFYQSCNAHASTITGELSFPQFPDKYGNNQHCIQTIKVPTGFKVYITFDFIQLEKSKKCSMDKIMMKDEVSKKKSRILCGSIETYEWLSDSNKVSLEFKSDGGTNGRGYYASYKAMPSNFTIPPEKGSTIDPKCSFEITYPSAVFTSTNYPNDYPPWEYCMNFITVPQGKRILFNFTQVDLEKSDDCLYDYIYAGDTNDLKNSNTGRICGRYSGYWLSKSNRVGIAFKSDGDGSASGFRFEYMTVDEDYVLPTVPAPTKDASCPCGVVVGSLGCMCAIIEANPQLAQQMINNYYATLNSIIGNIG